MASSRKKEISDEDYWQTSSATKLKSKGNLFDDSVDLDAAKRYLKQPIGEDIDDQDDTINWDGTTSGADRVEFVKSARFRPSLSNVGVPAGQPRPAVDGGGQGLQSRVSAPNYSSDLSIHDVVSSSVPPKKQATLTEIAKLETQINFLQRQLEVAKKDRFSSIPVRDTVKRIIFGQPYSLEAYKSKEDKLNLLDEAIAMHDGNAIITTLLFLKDTIKLSMFNLELMQRPVAVHQYIHFLKQHADWQELLDLLGMIGQTEEAAMLKYKQAAAIKNAESKIKSLQTCYRTHFVTDASLSHETSLVKEHISLLERQLPIEDADVKGEKAGELKFKEFPRAASILNQPVLTTLYYCCMYHYDLGENSLASPLAIRKAHQLTDKQFMWVALNARARLKMWKDIETLFQTKGWFGGTKMKSAIGFDKVVATLHKFGAPRNILNKYCSLVEDSENRLEVAHKYQCHETAIETYKAMKDRLQLIQYSSNLKNSSQEWFYAQDVLRSSTIKWKN